MLLWDFTSTLTPTVSSYRKFIEKQVKQVVSVGMQPRATRNAMERTKNVLVSGSPPLSGIVLTLSYL